MPSDDSLPPFRDERRLALHDGSSAPSSRSEPYFRTAFRMLRRLLRLPRIASSLSSAERDVGLVVVVPPFRPTLATGAEGKSRLGDPEVEKTFLERFRAARKRPDSKEVVHLFWFMSRESEDLNNDAVFSELCDFAATIANSFSPEEIELIFTVCFKHMAVPHRGLLQSVADVLTSSNDLTPFAAHQLVRILSCVARRHREDRSAYAFRPVDSFFPEQQTFLRMLLGELAREERLRRAEITDLADIYCSAAALGMSGKLLQIVRDELLRGGALGQLTAKQLAHVSYASAMLDGGDLTLLAAVAQAFPGLADDPEGSEYLGMVLYSLAAHADRVVVPPSVAAVYGAVKKEHLEQLNNEELACLFYSVGKLRLSDARLLDLLSAETVKSRRMSTMEGRQLLSVLHALQSLQVEKSNVLLAALSREILVGNDAASGSSRMSALKTFELCGVLHAWARLGLHRDWGIVVVLSELTREERRKDLTPDVVALALHAMGATGVFDEEALAILESEWLSEHKLAKFEDKLLGMVVYGLSKMRRRDSLRLLPPAVNAFVKRVRAGHRDTVTLAGVVHALASVRYPRSEAADALIRELVEEDRVKSMSARCLASVVYSVARLNCLGQRRGEMVGRLVEEALLSHRLMEIDNHGLSTLIWSLGRVKHRPVEHVKTFVQELLQPRRRDDLEKRGCVQLVHVVSALASLRVEGSGDILEEISGILLRKGSHVVSSRGLVQFVTRMEQLNYHNVELYTALVREAIRRDRRGKMIPGGLPMILEAVGRLGLHSVFGELLSSGLRDLEDIQRHRPADLRRLLKAFVSSKAFERRDLVERIENRLRQIRSVDLRRVFPLPR